MLRSISTATFAVTDFDGSVDAVRNCFGYTLAESGTIDATLAAFWQAPAMTGARYCVLGPAGGEPVYLRYVESVSTPGYAPLRTYGWNAAELHVADVDGLAEELAGSPFRILGGPRDLLENGAAIALQVQGPSDEVFYLTQLNSPQLQRMYGKATAAVGRLFIAVLGARDLDTARAHYGSLGLATPRPRQFAIRVLAAAHGLDPLATRFPIASAVLREAFRIEIDGYPASATTRPTLDGRLPPGFCLLTCTRDAARGTGVAGQARIGSHAALPYRGRGATLMHGADAELIEVLD